MAVLEQLVFGYQAGADQRRGILGQSPGLTRDCAQEVVRLCEGWGAVPAEGLRRSVLLSFPLITRLPTLPGELYAVIRICEGLQPVYHAVVVNLQTYQQFDLNPFTLAQEDIFVSAWEAGLEMSRREVAPGALAPLVSPPPGPADLGSVDEAVRQMLANQRLLLPLERSGSDSDRFLALTVACLPRVLRQDLRFASWAPSGTNRYSLAATYREMAMFTSWQPYLMTSIVGDIGPTCDEYLAGVRRCLRDGDLASLERLSASSRVELSRPGSGLRRAKPQAVAATVDERTARKVEQRQRGRALAPGFVGAGRGMGGASPRPPAAPSARGACGDKRPTRPRRPRRFQQHHAGRTVAVILAVMILIAGGYYLWQTSHGRPLPATSPPPDFSLRLDARHQIVDVAHLYRRLFDVPQAAGQVEVAAIDQDRRRRGLDALLQAGQLLRSQGQDYLHAADQVLAGVPQAGDPAPLQERGQRLAGELRRLALAQVSWQEQIDWRDLADLSRPRLQARLDSLLQQRQQLDTLEPDLGDVRQLLSGIDARARVLGGLVTLESILAEPSWQPDWERRVHAAVDQLGAARQRRVRQLRDDAFLLYRLKRAEHATDFASLALVPDDLLWQDLTPAVADILPEVLARATADLPDEPPALLRATAALYAALARAASPQAASADLRVAAEELAHNRAVLFDPAVYGDHLVRLRFRLMQRMLAEGTPRDGLPDVCFGGGEAAEHLAFHDLAASQPSAGAWQVAAASFSEPFLRRWALHRAGAAAVAQTAAQPRD